MSKAPPSPATGLKAYWTLTPEDLMALSGSSPQGLSAAEAAERLRAFGPNRVTDAKRVSIAALMLRQWGNPLVLILVFAAIVAAGLGEWLEASIILVIVLGSTLLGFAQEHRASSAMAALSRRLELTARVRRDGQVQTIPLSQVVPGDLVLLSAGAVAPGDAVILEAQDLLASEAALTGESFPVEKRPGTAPPQTPPAQRFNTVFLGSSIRSGSGLAVVVATGRRTQFGLVAERLRARPVETEFARGVRRFGFLLIRLMTLVVLSVLIANQLLGRPFLESLLFAVALGVGMSPELLPAIVSVTLTKGARRMAQKGVIVRRLDAIENLGAMTVFCTDKTGTLTEGAIQMKEAVDPFGAPAPDVRRLGFLNATFETGIENPLDQAVVADGRAAALSSEDVLKIDEIPYDFTRKRLSIVVEPRERPDERLMITKGAYAAVMGLCSRYASANGEVALDADARARIEAWQIGCGQEGLRLLAVATRQLDRRADYTVLDEEDLCLRGFLVFMDPPKPDAAPAIRRLAGLGVQVKVISGDNRHVVAHLARVLGLNGAMLTGEDLMRLKDEALWNRAARTTLFAEVDPQQKERIVRALQRTGHAVGYLGDGINDAPALYAADVGISVDQAVDVARESADVVLLKRDLDVLGDGIEDGRRAFANTFKYICITISANFGNMISMALATPLLPFLPMAAKQILLNNLLSDIPAIALSSDRVDAAQVARPQRMGTAQILRFMLTFGLLSSIFDGLAFVLLLGVLHAGETAFQTAWFVLSLLTELAVLLVLRTPAPTWRSRPGALLGLATLFVAAMALVAPYLGLASQVFGFTPLPPAMLAALCGLTVAYMGANEVAKRIYFRSGR